MAAFHDPHSSGNVAAAPDIVHQMTSAVKSADDPQFIAENHHTMVRSRSELAGGLNPSDTRCRRGHVFQKVIVQITATRDNYLALKCGRGMPIAGSVWSGDGDACPIEAIGGCPNIVECTATVAVARPPGLPATQAAKHPHTIVEHNNRRVRPFRKRGGKSEFPFQCTCKRIAIEYVDFKLL